MLMQRKLAVGLLLGGVLWLVGCIGQPAQTLATLTPLPPDTPGVIDPTTASPPTGYPFVPTDVPPPTMYPGQATPTATFNAEQLAEQYATGLAVDQTREAAETASVPPPPPTWTPMPDGHYVDPQGRYEFSLPDGWRLKVYYADGCCPTVYNYPEVDFGTPEAAPPGGVAVTFAAGPLPPDIDLAAYAESRRQAELTGVPEGDPAPLITALEPFTLGDYQGLSMDIQGFMIGSDVTVIFLPIGSTGVIQIGVSPAGIQGVNLALPLLQTLKLNPPPN